MSVTGEPKSTRAELSEPGALSKSHPARAWIYSDSSVTLISYRKDIGRLCLATRRDADFADVFLRSIKSHGIGISVL